MTISASFILGLRENHERAAGGASARVSDLKGHPEAIRRVGIVGGGTAGFLAALALRARMPHLEITLLESKAIPIIGVGEATDPHIVPFLHRTCMLDPHDFYARVRPTWKQGIRFEWGSPGGGHFHAPFDWDSNNIGLLGSLAGEGDINSMTLQARLMERRVAPIVDRRGARVSLLPWIPVAYHLENRRLVRYLTEVAEARGIRHLDRTIVDVVAAPEGGAVDHLVTDQGESLSFDLYLDCTGFRSLLLGKCLETPFESFASSLYTDRALTFSVDNGGAPDPYTTATTCEGGWTWTIPHEDRDHHGYVFASAFTRDDEAEREARRRWPAMGEVSGVVRFRSGRHREAWRGNVVALGNAFAFVEPLESTGLLAICVAIEKLVALFPATRSDRAGRALFNAYMTRQWDALRWFLAIHYKFNQRLDTPFWRAVRADADVSGAAPLIDAFTELGPLSLQDDQVLELLHGSGAPLFYGLHGWDCLLLGQGVPTRMPPSREPPERWEARRAEAEALASTGLDHAAALAWVHAHPELLADQLDAPDGWVQGLFAATA
ncbi:MAG: tryptophan halogenase family protein [Nannocystaceae bacterium]